MLQAVYVIWEPTTATAGNKITYRILSIKSPPRGGGLFFSGPFKGGGGLIGEGGGLFERGGLFIS